MNESPMTPQTPEPADSGGDTFEEQPGSGTPERHPTDKEPRGNPPVDEDALQRGKDALDRVSPH